MVVVVVWCGCCWCSCRYCCFFDCKWWWMTRVDDKNVVDKGMLLFYVLFARWWWWWCPGSRGFSSHVNYCILLVLLCRCCFFGVTSFRWKGKMNNWRRTNKKKRWMKKTHRQWREDTSCETEDDTLSNWERRTDRTRGQNKVWWKMESVFPGSHMRLEESYQSSLCLDNELRWEQF